LSELRKKKKERGPPVKGEGFFMKERRKSRIASTRIEGIGWGKATLASEGERKLHHADQETKTVHTF